MILKSWEWEMPDLLCKHHVGDDRAMMPGSSWYSVDLDQRQNLWPGGANLLRHFHVSLYLSPCSLSLLHSGKCSSPFATPLQVPRFDSFLPSSLQFSVYPCIGYIKVIQPLKLHWRPTASIYTIRLNLPLCDHQPHPNICVFMSAICSFIS